MMYEKGRGVPKDDCAAVEWFQKAVDRESTNAPLIFGIMYHEGKGMARDRKKVRLHAL